MAVGSLLRQRLEHSLRVYMNTSFTQPWDSDEASTRKRITVFRTFSPQVGNPWGDASLTLPACLTLFLVQSSSIKTCPPSVLCEMNNRRFVWALLLTIQPAAFTLTPCSNFQASITPVSYGMTAGRRNVFLLSPSRVSQVLSTCRTFIFISLG
jgi:hypothetical protein